MDLAKVLVKAGLDLSCIEPYIFVGLICFDGNLPLTGVDRPDKELSIDIGHLDRIFSLDGPHFVGGISGIKTNMKGGSLQQFYCMYTGDAYNN